VALLMALEWEDVEVLGISVVSGNMSVEQGSINARYTVELCKKDVPVYVGADAPLVKKKRTCGLVSWTRWNGQHELPCTKTSRN
ncbi:nucleoside hydrolase, partial [Acidimicrobiia bacterium]|nr:nucleoside hydrolase [Acidimicrobiia bacterium]